MARRSIVAILLLACSTRAIASKPGYRHAAPHSPETSRPAPAAPFAVEPGAKARVPVTLAEDGQWTMASKDPYGTRYSGLDQITTSNVASLKESWSYATGNDHGHEGAPLVVNGMLYLVTPFPNELLAFDLRAPGKLAWKATPKVNPSAEGIACCDVVNRGCVFDRGRIFFGTLDGQAVAVDATTGAIAWTVALGDVNKGETITMAPIVASGRVLFGDSGGEMGVRGWVTALDEDTGAFAWRAYATGPDADCLIGPRFKPHYAMDQGKDLGVTTWPPDAWRIGGGTAWGWITADPATGVVYYGTANPGPWNPAQRPGDNKWTAGVFARDAATGDALWFYQWSPHDVFDHDGINESLVLDATIAGADRKLLVHPERNGYVYVLDRLTGEVLSADPFEHVTTSRGVDLETGRLIVVADKEPKPGTVVRDACPAAPGAKDWEPSSFSPRTGLLYIPHLHLCEDVEGVEANYIAGTPYVGANVRMFPGPGGKRGRLTAWDPLARKARFVIEEDLPLWSGTVVTAGDVVFYGTMDGVFKAISAIDGKLLWSTQLPSGIIGQPMTFLGPDGKQQVAICSGVGGWAGAVALADVDPRDGTAALGFVNAMSDLKQRTKPGGTLHVFALP